MIQRGQHHRLPDAFSAKLGTHNDRAEKGEPAVGGRREHTHDATVRFRDEAALRGEGEESEEVSARVAPVLEVRQGDRGGDVSLFELPDVRSFHIFTRRSSSSTSSHSW